MKDKNLDKILKQLGDFDPQAKPDWDAFIADNESQISRNENTPGNGAGKSIASNRTLRYAGIFAAAVVALFMTWYFTGTSLDTATQQVLPETQDVEVTGDQQDKAPEAIEKIGIDKIEINQPEVEIQPNLKDDAKALKMQIIETGQIENAELPEIINDKPAIKPASSPTVIIKDTVFMKKTIYVTDTVKRK